MTAAGRRLRVAVLYGGPSREHEISLLSGRAVSDALTSAGHDVVTVRIREDGLWLVEPGPGGDLPPGAPAASAASPARTLVVLETASDDRPRVDVVFVALHGRYGEDGTVQGFLEAAGIPYTGSGVAASAVAMDKERTKEVLSFHGVVSPPWLATDRTAYERDPDAFLARVEDELGLPAIVKPPREGSSFGITVAVDGSGLREAVEAALATAEGRALVERRIEGVEVTCPVLGNRGGALETLPLVEIVPAAGRSFFDFAAKYEGASREICPARVSPQVAGRVREASLTAHRVLGCDGLGRSDFIVDQAGVAWFLETNTVPGMTAGSLCPLSARRHGWSFEELCERVVTLAVDRAESGRGRPVRSS